KRSVDSPAFVVRNGEVAPAKTDCDRRKSVLFRDCAQSTRTNPIWNPPRSRSRSPFDPPSKSWFVPPHTKKRRSGHASRTLQRARIRAQMAQGLGGRAGFQDPERRSAAKILRARDVPLSVGAHSYGPRAQLCDGRRGRALPARARL